MQPQKIAVALSGGVDSAVTAWRLQQEGHDIVGLFVKTWDDADPHCPAAVDAQDARMMADKLGIPFYSFDLQKEYREEVFAHFLAEHTASRTPNPDILCNRHIKFGALWDIAQKLGCTHLATGHYARRIYNAETGLHELHIPKDTEKDQTYFLSAITQQQLSRALFPLEDMTKPQVRDTARDLGFTNADKKGSAGICFVGERDYAGFLKEYFPPHPGDILTDKGEKVGTHEGLLFYTLGQRKGFSVGGVRGAQESPWFVYAKDETANTLHITQDETRLLRSELTVTNLHFIGTQPEGETFSAQAKVRYRSEAVPCTVQRKDAGAAHITFDTPVRAATPGQYVVLYDGTQCLGCGVVG